MSMKDTRRNACKDVLQHLDKMTQTYFESVDTLKEKIASIDILDDSSSDDEPAVPEKPVKSEFPFIASLSKPSDAVVKPVEVKKDNADKKCSDCAQPATTTREFGCLLFPCKNVVSVPVCEVHARYRLLKSSLRFCNPCKRKMAIRAVSWIKKPINFVYRMAICVIMTVIVVLLFAFAKWALTLTMSDLREMPSKDGVTLIPILSSRHKNTPPVSDTNYGTVWAHDDYTWTGFKYNWGGYDCLNMDRHIWITGTGHANAGSSVVCLNYKSQETFNHRVAANQIELDDVFDIEPHSKCERTALIHKRTGEKFCIGIR